MVWSETSPSSWAGTVTRELQNNHFSYGYEAILLLLICKLTLNGPAPCLPSPSQTCWGGDILYSRTPQGLDPVTNSPFWGPWASQLTPCYKSSVEQSICGQMVKELYVFSVP